MCYCSCRGKHLKYKWRGTRFLIVAGSNLKSSHKYSLRRSNGLLSPNVPGLFPQARDVGFPAPILTQHCAVQQLTGIEWLGSFAWVRFVIRWVFGRALIRGKKPKSGPKLCRWPRSKLMLNYEEEAIKTIWRCRVICRGWILQSIFWQWSNSHLVRGKRIDKTPEFYVRFCDGDGEFRPLSSVCFATPASYWMLWSPLPKLQLPMVVCKRIENCAHGRLCKIRWWASPFFF